MSSVNTKPRHQRPSDLKKFLFGTAYYPEHWSDSERERDPQLMAEACINVVRMAEFAWGLIEPRPGEYDFSLFDETVERLAEQGIQTILCTPTAAPPIRLTIAHPDWLRRDADGLSMVHGSRQHCCTTNSGFREASRSITLAMAGHYADNPNVIGWQTDNELNCHFSECHCKACAFAFQLWLREKYGEVTALNTSWGTSFWGQCYDVFEQIGLPKANRPAFPNPAQMLDYHRFLSDSVVEFHREQVAILRAAQPRWWITHNGTFDHLDYWKLAGDLNFLGVDVYPGFAPEQPEGSLWAALKLEECRAESGNFMVPEQQGGAGGQPPFIHQTPQPGQMRLWTWQSIAHGADGVLHFRWRTCRFGAEIYWCGILDHDNIPRRRFQECSQEGKEIQRIGAKILGTVANVHAGILLELDQDEAHETFPMGRPGPQTVRKLIYSEMMKRHLPVGLVDARDDFAGLDLLVMPSFPLIDDDLADRLRDFVVRGGTLVATGHSATRDRRNQVIMDTPPGCLTSLFGARVIEFGRLGQKELVLKAGERKINPCWGYEILDPFDATIIGEWMASPPHAARGCAAMVTRQTGAGRAIYLGTWPSEENVADLVETILAHRKIAPLAMADPFVEIICRFQKHYRLTFVLNHYAENRLITNLPWGFDLISQTESRGSLELSQFGVAIIKSEETSDYSS